MGNLARILGFGFLVFLALSMTQEWEVFRPWLLGEHASAKAGEAGAAERLAAESAVRELLSMASHYYSSRNDPRFLERMPARGWVVDEMRADVEYLLRNGRVQEMKLLELEVLNVELRGERRAQVRTRERWRIRTVSAEGTGEGDPARESALECRYSVAQTGRAWQVVDWDAALAAAEPPPSVPGGAAP
jgi:hypothetical protein